MAKWTPEQEALYALQWDLPRSDLSMAVQVEYDRLKADRERSGIMPAAAEPVDRFPSAPDVRRQILEAIAARNTKYAKPFDKGKMASFSLIGTESWSEYGAVVLQMAILDTLLSIEAKLGKLVEAPRDA
jgi:hypothetical protein